MFYQEAILAERSKEARDQAAARLKKAEDRAREGKKAMAEHEAAEKAVRERTARLRSQRLAREAAEEEAQAAKQKEPQAAKQKSSAKKG